MVPGKSLTPLYFAVPNLVAGGGALHMAQLLPFFLLFPDKLTDPGVHSALARFKLYVITREKQK